jgi:putative membrane protein
MKPVKFIRTAAAAAAMALLSSTALADSQVTAQVPSLTTQHFIENAANSNMLEIQSSQRAQKATGNKEILDFAQKMIEDHQNAEKELEATLRNDGKGFEKLVPTAIDAKGQKTVDRLNGETGMEFEKDYLKVQREGHDDAVKMFDKYSKSGDTPALKDFAAKTLPTLQEHQRMAHDLYDNYGKGKSASSGTGMNAMEPAAGNRAVSTNNPNLDHPDTNANTTGNREEPTTANPTEGKSSPSGGPPL